MISQVPEKNMHLVRWLLAIGWLTLIFSLFYDPISIHLTDPANTWSPFHLHPEQYLDPESCVKVRTTCLPEKAYGMGGRIFWAMVLPIGILILLVLGHETWRRICPLYFFSQIPRALKIQRKKPDPDTQKPESVGIEKESWLGRNYLYLQYGLFYLGLNIRILFVNGDRTAMAIFLLFTIFSAIAVGYLFKGRSWCQYFCPMAPVQIVYTGPRGLLGTKSHLQPQDTITQSMCREVDGQTGKDKKACVACQSPCFDIDSERSYWDGINKPDQKMVFYGYFGLMFGFYFFYFVYSGNWEYYYSGAWTHEETQLRTLFNPGFYIAGHALPIPKIIAAPITIAVCAVIGYWVCLLFENLYRRFLKGRNINLSPEQIQHHCFMVCTFLSFNVFFMFGGRPNISLLPDWTILVINGFVVGLSSLWLYRNITTSKDSYSRESLAGKLRNQLNKIAVDWDKFLEGRSLQQLQPNEVYVLAKVLPGVKQDDKLRIYKGVLQESLEEGNIKSADSLDVLMDVRKSLDVTDEEHFAVLSELDVETPSLLDPQKQRSRENQLRVEGYKRSLEFLILESVETGTPAQEVVERKQRQIQALRQEYAITTDEQDQVLSEILNQDGPLLRNAENLLSQLQQLSIRHQALSNLSPNPTAAVYILLRQSVQEKQRLITSQLLSILEILGETPEAIEIANYTGLYAANLMGEILKSQNQQAKWQQRLTPRIITTLRQGLEQITQPASGMITKLSTGSPTRLNTNLLTKATTIAASTQSPQGVNLPPEAIIDELMKMQLDIDPLVQAASLYALKEIKPELAFQQAKQFLDNTSVKDELLKETAERIIGQGQAIRTSTVLPTFIAKVKTREGVERKDLQKPVIKVGRDPQNDIVISDNRVSRQHAIFYLSESGVKVKDLGSSNGLRIGKEFLKDQEMQLNQGDTVRFSTGDDVVIFVQWQNKVQQGDTIAESLSTFDKLLYLYKSNFFMGLKSNSLVEIARNSKERLYRPEEIITRIGDPANQLLILIDGTAKVIQAITNKPQSSQPMLPGASIGELELLTRTTHSTTVAAASSRTRVLSISAQDFEAAIFANPQLARNLMGTVGSRLMNAGV
jgi:FHA domain/Cyclic nucleotide-binding domain